MESLDSISVGMKVTVASAMVDGRTFPPGSHGIVMEKSRIFHKVLNVLVMFDDPQYVGTNQWWCHHTNLVPFNVTFDDHPELFRQQFFKFNA